jgi:beta-galactosidase
MDVSAQGRLLGMCNGDPSNHESEKSPFLRVFNGLAQALVQSTDRGGDIRVRANSPGLTGSSVTLRAYRHPLRPRA